MLASFFKLGAAEQALQPEQAPPPVMHNSQQVATARSTLASIRAQHANLEGGSWYTERVEQSYIHQAVKSGDVVLEIGANIGRSTIMAAAYSSLQVGRVTTGFWHLCQEREEEEEEESN